MSDSKPNKRDKYVEGCNALRHYSNCVINIRTVTIVQGLAVLGAAGYLIKEGLFFHSLLAVIFGLLLSGVLFGLHRNYYDHFNVILKHIAEDIEKDGPWRTYKDNRDKNLKKYKWTHYGPFILLALSLLALFIYDAVQLCCQLC